MFMQNRHLMKLLPLASILLAACGTHQTRGPGQSVTSPQWQQHQQEVQKITRYQTRGAFVWLSDSQKIYARFNWQQTAPDRYRLLLTNPLGSTELQLDVQGSVVQIVDSKGKRYAGNNAGKMIAQLTGMNIPLDNLHLWMMGLPGDATDYSLDNQYRLHEVNYSRDGQQWRVNYQGYDSQQQPNLPSSMELHAGRQRIKLKMDGWTVK